MSSSENEDMLLFLSVERVAHPARGRHGGLDGACGRIRLDGHDRDLPSKGEVRIPAGAHLVFDTPGGGGFGPPRERPKDAVTADLDAGVISRDAARNTYRHKS